MFANLGDEAMGSYPEGSPLSTFEQDEKPLTRRKPTVKVSTPVQQSEPQAMPIRVQKN